MNDRNALAKKRGGVADKDLPGRKAPRAYESSLRGFWRSREDSRFSEYEYRKLAWIERNPDSTPEAYEKAIRKIADELGL